MPLHVYIDINDTPIETLHIGRIKGGTSPDDINTYVAVIGDRPLYLEEWEKRGVKFTHRYGDMALVCVRKAIEAIEGKNAPIDKSKKTSQNIHHCGFDFKPNKATAKCKCGAIATNPYYVNKERK